MCPTHPRAHAHSGRTQYYRECPDRPGVDDEPISFFIIETVCIGGFTIE